MIIKSIYGEVKNEKVKENAPNNLIVLHIRDNSDINLR